MIINLATLYIILGFISFIASAITIVILVKKFIEQPAAHGFFSYSDTLASGLLSLGLLLDGVIGVFPDISTKSCYHLKLLYGLFVVAIVTGFFSVLGMAIERFQAFAVYRNHRHITRKFSIAWFLSSWTLSILFVMILLPQIREKENTKIHIRTIIQPDHSGDQFLQYFPASSIFPGPHTADNITQYVLTQPEDVEDDACTESKGHRNKDEAIMNKVKAEYVHVFHNISNITTSKFNGIQEKFKRINDRMMKLKTTEKKSKTHNSKEKRCPTKSIPETTQEAHKTEQGQTYNNCVVRESFIKYYFLLLFLLCFITPVLITISLNFFISFAVKNTHHESISHHQWLTLAACVLMWGPSLTELLLEKSKLIDTPDPVSVFLFLLGHMHNLLRSVLHVLFAQQIHSSFTQRTAPDSHQQKVANSGGRNKIRPAVPQEMVVLEDI